MASVPLSSHLASLAAPRTSLIGRMAELARARSLLLDAAVPLLTLTGPGGVGKTRLALAVAHDVADAFAAGVVFVDLSPIRDPALVLPAIAQTLGVREVGDRPLADLVAAFLRPKQVLLVLDNCEQVLPAAPDVAALLATSPALQVLATSRAPLRVRGEHRFPVEPLPIPPADQEVSPAEVTAIASVELFVQRVRAIEPSFSLTEQNAAAVAEICRRLDGLPLALELAAARLRLLSPAALLALLSDRLRVLTGGERDLPDRQRTLRDTIAWSYDLLAPAEQALFRRLAVFAGGFDVEAATMVTDDDPVAVLDCLSALADQSLVHRIAGGADSPRWTLLETVREFGLEQLAASGEEEATRARHLAWCIATVETAWPPGAATPAYEQAPLRLDAERDNIRAALAWTIERGEADAALRLVGGLAEYWWRRFDLTEGLAWSARALALPGGTPAHRAAALFTVAALAWSQGDTARARESAAQSLALAWTHGTPLDMLRARHLVDMMSEVADPAALLASAEETLALARQVGEPGWLGYATNGLGGTLFAMGDAARAAPLHEEALRHFAALSDRNGEMYATLNLATVVHSLGRRDDATRLYRRGGELARLAGNPLGTIVSIVGLAELAADHGHAEMTARLLGVAEALGELIGQRDAFVHQRQERAAARARDRLGNDAFDAAWNAGRALARDPAAVDALIADTDPTTSPAVVPAAPASASAPFGLSPRERDVLLLLAQHLTDKEIAAALFISPRTVMTHVAGILTKLDAPNRRQAAILAAREGLV